MPDIALCTNEACPRRLLCYRHEARATNPHRQTYMDFKPDADGSCDWFKPMRDEPCLKQ